MNLYVQISIYLPKRNIITSMYNKYKNIVYMANKQAKLSTKQNDYKTQQQQKEKIFLNK